MDSYDGGEVMFLTQIATTGDVSDRRPSVSRTMSIALLQAMDQSKLDAAFEALAQIQLGVDALEIKFPDQIGDPISLCAAVGDHGLVPFEMEDD